MKNILFVVLFFSISFSFYKGIDGVNGLKGKYKNQLGDTKLKVSFGEHTNMMFINGEHYDCFLYEPYRYLTQNYKYFYKTNWAPSHSFFFFYLSNEDGDCYKDKGHLIIVIENDGLLFDNYSEVVFVSNVHRKNVSKVVDNPLHYGDVLYKRNW